MSQIHQHELSNGLKLIAEPMASAQSLAMSMLIPAGVMVEQENQLGLGALLSEMLFRGAGELDAKAHSQAMDDLGLSRGVGVETYHLNLGATMIGLKVKEAMPLLMDMVRKPMLCESALEPSRDLALQAIEALEDEPQQKVFLKLKNNHFPQPFGRSALGVAQDIKQITLDDIKQFWQAHYVPKGSILSFAGRFDFEQLKDQVQDLLGDWQGQATPVEPGPPACRGYEHEEAQSTQVHIGLMYDAPAEPDDDSLLCKVAASVLSGGMSGRLFTEVREKRGLCYAVYAAYAGNKDRGAMLSYAGTTAARAQETLDVLTGEHLRLAEGISESEFNRAIVGMKSRLVMQGESTSARARSLATDQAIHGKPRTLGQLIEQVDGVTFKAVQDYVATHQPKQMTIATIGPEALKVGQMLEV